MMATENLIIERYLLLVDQHFAEQEYYEGRKLLEEALFVDPTHGTVHSYLGWYYYAQMNDFGRANTHYAISMKAENVFPGTYSNYATVLMKLRRFQDVIALCTQGLEAPGVADAYMWIEIAHAREMLGEYKAAKVACEEGLKVAMDEFVKVQLTSAQTRTKEKLKRAAPWYALTL